MALYGVCVRFIIEADTEDAATSEVNDRLTGITDVDEIWTETRYED